MASTWKHLAQIRWTAHAHSNHGTHRNSITTARFTVTGLIPNIDLRRINVFNSFKNFECLIRQPPRSLRAKIVFKIWTRLRKMRVGEPANCLIVSCGLSNGPNMLYKGRGSFLCVRRSFDHNRAWILMIAHVITFTPGNGDLVRPSYHTSYAGIINHAVYRKPGPYPLWACHKHAVYIFTQRTTFPRHRSVSDAVIGPPSVMQTWAKLA